MSSFQIIRVVYLFVILVSESQQGFAKKRYGVIKKQELAGLF